MILTEFPIHVSDSLLPGSFEIFELRLKFNDGHGAMSITHLRAGDRNQAVEVGHKYCKIHGAKFIGTYPFCVADPSILDEPTTLKPLASRTDSESVEERVARQSGRGADVEHTDDSATRPPSGRGRVGA